MNIDLAGVTQAQAAVLVEGMSGKAALEALAERRGQMPGGGGICVVAMGGAASAGPALAPGRGFQRFSSRRADAAAGRIPRSRAWARCARRAGW
jgi:hypothetical protein